MQAGQRKPAASSSGEPHRRAGSSGATLATDALRASGFCCTGCRTAFALLQAHGLGAYHTMADRREAPVR